MKFNLKWMMALLIAASFSCGDAPSVLPPADNNDNSQIDNNAPGDEDVPKGIHWREEIGTFKFSPDRAVNWDYSEEGVIVIPADEVADSITKGEEDLSKIKVGDVIMVWENISFL